jgi:formylglycine-generating enzyme required for sulfatase activity
MAYHEKKSDSKSVKRGILLLCLVISLSALAHLFQSQGQGGNLEQMLLIPAGEFLMGINNGDSDESPQQRVFVEAFYIDLHEVTLAEYQRFVEATGHRAPRFWIGNVPPTNNRELPVTFVSWEDAQAYCQWAGKRLPTETEWEKAARGTDGRKWPWGNQFEKTKCNGNRHPRGKIERVGSYPLGRSPYGLLDMAGNVWEWTADWYTSYPGSPQPFSHEGEYRIVRGGAHFNSPSYLRCASRMGADPKGRYDFIGFRCAKDAP